MKLDPRLDLDLCLSCGQLFRWRKQGDTWHGYLDEHAVSIRDHVVTSTAPAELLESFFAPDGDAWSIAEDLAHLDPERARVYLDPRLHGLRLLRLPNPVETTFSFLCSSNNHISRISAMVQSLADYGDQGRFPTVERIAEITEQALRDRGFGYRAKTIPAAAREIVLRGGQPWLVSLAELPYEAAVGELIELPGIGPKLADCIALFALGHGGAVPMDVHMWRAATQHYFPEWQGQAMTSKKSIVASGLFRKIFGAKAGVAHHFHFVRQLLESRAVR